MITRNTPDILSSPRHIPSQPVVGSEYVNGSGTDCFARGAKGPIRSSAPSSR